LATVVRVLHLADRFRKNTMALARVGTVQQTVLALPGVHLARFSWQVLEPGGNVPMARAQKCARHLRTGRTRTVALFQMRTGFMKITAITRYKHGALYAVLQRIGWTQSELARQSKMRIGTIADIINLVRRPSPEQADAIQNALGIAGEYLDVLSEWPETFAGMKRGYRIEQTAEVPMERLLDHPEVFQLAAPEPADDTNESDERLASVISELSGKEQIVLRERFWNGRTLQELSKKLGCTLNGIRYIEKRALRKLRHSKRISKLQLQS